MCDYWDFRFDNIPVKKIVKRTELSIIAKSKTKARRKVKKVLKKQGKTLLKVIKITVFKEKWYKIIYNFVKKLLFF